MTQDTQIAIRMSTQALAALDDLRRIEDDVPSRAEMIRRLIDRAAGEVRASEEPRPINPARDRKILNALAKIAKDKRK